jgi:hypothetical protein
MKSCDKWYQLYGLIRRIVMNCNDEGQPNITCWDNRCTSMTNNVEKYTSLEAEHANVMPARHCKTFKISLHSYPADLIRRSVHFARIRTFNNEIMHLTCINRRDEAAGSRFDSNARVQSPESVIHRPGSHHTTRMSSPANFHHTTQFKKVHTVQYRAVPYNTVHYEAAYLPNAPKVHDRLFDQEGRTWAFLLADH